VAVSDGLRSRLRGLAPLRRWARSLGWFSTRCLRLPRREPELGEGSGKGGQWEKESREEERGRTRVENGEEEGRKNGRVVRVDLSGWAAETIFKMYGWKMPAVGKISMGKERATGRGCWWRYTCIEDATKWYSTRTAKVKQEGSASARQLRPGGCAQGHSTTPALQLPVLPAPHRPLSPYSDLHITFAGRDDATTEGEEQRRGRHRGAWLISRSG